MRAPLLLTGCAGLFLLASCTTTRQAVPAELVSEAQIPGMPEVRTWGGEFSPHFQRSLVESRRQVLRHDPRGLVDETGTVNLLALSGGGANGAFGAGVLCGWTEAGTRPTFKLVTGISTGALIAPFAFLGPEYDDLLEQWYTGISTRDVARETGLLGLLLGSPALADTAPLERLITSLVDDAMIEAVATEHGRGRRLYVGTTHLDARRLMVWDLGAVAASGHPDRRELFCKVLLASAAIPVAFPPVEFTVEAGGKTYQELHVDGGVTAQVFYYGFMLDLDAAMREAGVSQLPRTHLYIIRNSMIRARYQEVEERLGAIAGRSIDALIAAQGVGDLYRIHAITQRDGTGYSLASIPADFEPEGTETFDPVEMRRLFDLGFEMARAGYPWSHVPPGFEDR